MAATALCLEAMLAVATDCVSQSSALLRAHSRPVANATFLQCATSMCTCSTGKKAVHSRGTLTTCRATRSRCCTLQHCEVCLSLELKQAYHTTHPIDGQAIYGLSTSHRLGIGVHADMAIAYIFWEEFGIMATDPGYGYFRPGINLFDPGWRLTPDGHDTGTHAAAVMDRQACLPHLSIQYHIASFLQSSVACTCV